MKCEERHNRKGVNEKGGMGREEISAILDFMGGLGKKSAFANLMSFSDVI